MGGISVFEAGVVGEGDLGIGREEAPHEAQGVHFDEFPEIDFPLEQHGGTSGAMQEPAEAAQAQFHLIIVLPYFGELGGLEGVLRLYRYREQQQHGRAT